jgi:phospholipid/cholesterol/gamma-HCH transport system ATP-binding protein
MDLASNVLLAQLHHRGEDPGVLRERAAELACSFGLPGLPLGRPDDLSAADQARAACVRAFLGRPALLLLETPTSKAPDLADALLAALAEARDDGAAAIWFMRRDPAGRPSAPWLPASHRLRLGETGLAAIARAPR